MIFFPFAAIDIFFNSNEIHDSKMFVIKGFFFYFHQGLESQYAEQYLKCL